MTTANFRRQLAEGELSLGTFVLEFAAEGIGPLAARAGADWVLYDLEHTGWSLDRIRPALAVSRREEIASFVRIIGSAQHLVSGALDAGAEGIMVPYVNTAEQAAILVQWMKYPPVGTRGSAFGIAHDLYTGGDPSRRQAEANASTVLLTQIETPEAVANVDEIAAVDGVDVLFVGPLDLSTNLGYPGDVSSPAFRSALARVGAAARDAGKAAGIFSGDDGLTQAAIAEGFQVISHSADVAIFQQGLSSKLTQMRSWHRG
ncbi:2-keto-3-deoxy-L-rhamnonate aldolase [Brevibacterium daeguense]|uniref:2-keto-3-deoxy-L-rhamnonate aldolase n=1 Tax=Brevibacterium daeguense TaxID=909936 RepID=A0ABP8EHY8_9MICO|nr:aldolase/citrate lyase family protein [Brevibacterium daeguense]